MANLLQFKQISKDSYFYNKYRYCLGFALDEVNALKSLDHDYIDTIIERRQIWREVAPMQRLQDSSVQVRHGPRDLSGGIRVE